eukprot:gene23920-biopygen7350
MRTRFAMNKLNVPNSTTLWQMGGAWHQRGVVGTPLFLNPTEDQLWSCNFTLVLHSSHNLLGSRRLKVETSRAAVPNFKGAVPQLYTAPPPSFPPTGRFPPMAWVPDDVFVKLHCSPHPSVSLARPERARGGSHRGAQDGNPVELWSARGKSGQQIPPATPRRAEGGWRGGQTTTPPRPKPSVAHLSP